MKRLVNIEADLPLVLSSKLLVTLTVPVYSFYEIFLLANLYRPVVREPIIYMVFHGKV